MQQAIAQHPEERSLHWHYGLALLLNHQAEDAQMTWLMVLAEADDAAAWMAELRHVLEAAALEQAHLSKMAIMRSLIRQCLCELDPTDAANWLHRLIVAVESHTLELDTFTRLGYSFSFGSRRIRGNRSIIAALCP